MAGADCNPQSAAQSNDFYVYEHIRLDTGAVFYVGKGSRYRVRVTQHRNPHWKAVANKRGWEPRIVFRTEDEELAFLVEEELIRRRRMDGAPLTNMTDGGEGMSGYVFPPSVAKARGERRRGIPNPKAAAALRGVPKSAEHRAKLAASRSGSRASEDARMKMSATRKGRPSSMKGKRHTDEAKAAISAAVSGEKNPFFGKQHPPALVERLRQLNIGRVLSDEVKKKMSESRSGHLNYHYGKPVSEARKAKQRATLMARPKLTCPHCGKSASDGNAKRWHFENCRSIA